ncbi:hypothetical protein SAMN05421820_110122 [Pedobacter steynii]|uniref:Tetratricopeptide repeat-containing protein n=1 Tax=Pedobacter steynii TaxID=430522 RepID=A0A1H0FAY5_9SPHI|nr:hypothetical protein [Pedobacter steynii]NQX42160.1 hypothetical protein [Pedobacter steynii]SDN91726.1 hypothetical protein SAMN05421820_110122 [Pedobacter steynii]
MEQEIDIRQELAVLLAEPEKVRSEHAPMLQDLVSSYPYFQPLHLLLAKASSGDTEKNSYLATAALYTNGQLLHNFLYEPDYLVETAFNIVFSPAFDQLSNQPETLDEAVLDEVPSESDDVYVIDTPEDDAIPTSESLSDQEKVADDFVLENIVSTDFFAFQENFSPEPAPEELPAASTGLEQIQDAEQKEEPVVISKYDDDQLPYTFLWWLHKTRKEYQQIFQPYVTLKKEPAVQTGTPNELQQQYVEHIFHLQSPFTEAGESDYNPSGLRNAHKGTDIIESFLKNDPQISPPNAEQINTENKAKKSAEDHNDLVSETLAKIYIEQMLYDKAIETYEKLSLKFPEKSRYFADLIQSIEKKI